MEMLKNLDGCNYLLVKPDGSWELKDFDNSKAEDYGYISNLLCTGLNCTRFALLRNIFGSKNGKKELDVYIDDFGKLKENPQINNFANELFDIKNEMPGDTLCGNVIFTIRGLIP